MRTKSKKHLPFESFLLLLQNEGFEIGVDTYVNVQKLLFKLSDRNIPFDEVGYVLRPLLAKNPSQQKLFDEVWEQYFQSIQKHNVTTFSTYNEKKEKKSTRDNLQLVVAASWAVGVIASLIVVYVLYLFFSEPPQPILSISTFKKNYVVGEEVNLKLNGLDSIGLKENQFIVWQIDESQKDTTLALNYVTLFKSVGTKTITVELIENNLSADDILRSRVTTTLQISCPTDNSVKPAFSIIADKNIRVNDTVSFINETVNYDSVILYYRWDYGNGNTSTGFEPKVQTYKNAESYTVILTVSKDSAFNELCKRFTTTEVVTIELEKTTIVLAPLPLDRAEESNLEVYYTIKVKVYLLLLFTLLAILWFLLKYLNQKRKVPNHLKRLLQTSDKPPLSIQFREKDEVVKQEKAFYELANGMRQRLIGTNARLDLKKTIESTAKSGGIPSFHFKQSTKPHEYLVLKQQGDRNNHLSRLFDLLIKFLIAEDLYLEVYYYKHNPMMCYHPLTDEKRSIEQLALQFPNYHLLIFGSGQGLLESKYPNLKEGLKIILRSWRERALFTPKPVSQWGYKEDLLKGTFRIFPADLHAMLHLLKPVSIENQGSLASLQKSYLTSENYDIKKVDFYEVESLKMYFSITGNEHLYQWLCAIMEYPTPNWELLLHIGQALEKDKKVEVNYSNLLLLARIPWMQDGDVPFDLRQKLLEELLPENRILVRQAILDMLIELDLEEESFAYGEVEALKLTKRYLLNPKDSNNQIAVYWLWKNNLLPDAHIKQALEKRSSILNDAASIKELSKKYQSIQPVSISIVTILLLILGIILLYNEIPQVNYNQKRKLVQKGWTYEKIPEVVKLNNLAVDTTQKGFFSDAQILINEALSKMDDKVRLGQLIQENNEKTAYNLNTVDYKEKNYYELTQLDSIHFLNSYFLHLKGAAYYMLDSVDLALEQLNNIMINDPTFFKEQPKPHLQSVLQNTLDTSIERNDNFILINGLLLQGRDFIERHKNKEAINTLYKINLIEYGQIGAEAQYLIAYALNKQAQYFDSNDALKRSLDTFIEFSEWAERSRLLKAQNFIALGDIEGAKNLLNNIISETYLQEIRVFAQNSLDSLSDVIEVFEDPPLYYQAIKKGDLALEQKKITQSLENYREALIYVPDDEYASNAVAEIQQFQEDQRAERGNFMKLLYSGEGFSDYEMIGNPEFTWAKAGYNTQYNDIFIEINEVDKINNKVIFEFRKSKLKGQAVLQTITLGVEKSIELEEGNTYYQIYLNRLGKVGKNPFSTAAFFTIAAYRKEGASNLSDKFFPEMVFVDGGTFEMGFKSGRDGKEKYIFNTQPLHNITLDAFYISKYEVTNAHYAAFLNSYGSNHVKNGKDAGRKMVEEHQWGVERTDNDWQPSQGYENHPVVFVSWFGANEYTKWLSQQTGLKFRLPTEAEWEYAARGGQKKSSNHIYAGSDTLGNVAWYDSNSEGKTHPVGQKSPNEIGLYDMSGNAWEWCYDWYEKSYYGSSPTNNPDGPKNGTQRVLRGGSWYFSDNESRIAHRFGDYPFNSYNGLSFRVVQVL